MQWMDDILGRSDQVPTVNHGARPDMTKVRPEDWSTLALVDGERSFDDICQDARMALQDARASLGRLVSMGLISLPKNTPDAPTPPEAKKKKGKGQVNLAFPTAWPVPVDQFLFDPIDLEADIEMTSEKRKQLMYYHYHLQLITYYDLFQVSPEASSRDIRTAYFKLSKEFHPDLFFRKDIGPLRTKLEETFKWISRAYAELSSSKKRAAYDAVLARGALGPWQFETSPRPTTKRATPPPAPTPAPTPPPTPAPSQPPQRSIQDWMALAKRKESLKLWSEAALCYDNALRLEERFVPVLALRAAQALWKAGDDLERAESFARRALQDPSLDPKIQLDALLLQGNILERLGRAEEARASYQRAHTLEPDHALVHVFLRRLDARSTS